MELTSHGRTSNRAMLSERMGIERLAARIFTLLGGIFWILMLFGSNTSASYATFVYPLTELGNALLVALIPLVLVAAVFAVGMFYEKVAAGLLFAAAAGTLVWGIVAGWSGVVLWMTVGLVLIAPMLVAGTLYLLAARNEARLEKEAVA